MKSWTRIPKPLIIFLLWNIFRLNFAFIFCMWWVLLKHSFVIVAFWSFLRLLLNIWNIQFVLPAVQNLHRIVFLHFSYTIDFNITYCFQFCLFFLLHYLPKNYCEQTNRRASHFFSLTIEIWLHFCTCSMFRKCVNLAKFMQSCIEFFVDCIRSKIHASTVWSQYLQLSKCELQYSDPFVKRSKSF